MDQIITQLQGINVAAAVVVVAVVVVFSAVVLAAVTTRTTDKNGLKFEGTYPTRINRGGRVQ